MILIYRLFREHWIKFRMWGLDPLAPHYGDSVINLANIKDPYYGKRRK